LRISTVQDVLFDELAVQHQRVLERVGVVAVVGLVLFKRIQFLDEILPRPILEFPMNE
jgi:hypothetical protein